MVVNWEWDSQKDFLNPTLVDSRHRPIQTVWNIYPTHSAYV